MGDHLPNGRREPLLVGAHMSIAGGVTEALRRGAALGCTAVQLFTKNASRWEGTALPAGAADLFRRTRAQLGIRAACAHDAYLINLASPDRELLARSRRAFLDELRRAEALGLDCVVAHPGAHTGSGVARGLATVAESLDWVHARTPGFAVRVCLENTAGQGTLLAGEFGHLSEILARAARPERIGVCLDTCHAYAAGYDLRTPEAYEGTVAALAAAVGVERVRVLHLNDARGELGSRLDRHEHLGRGRLGVECFRLFMNDPRFGGVPRIIETPKLERGREMDRVNLALLWALAGRRPPRPRRGPAPPARVSGPGDGRPRRPA